MTKNKDIGIVLSGGGVRGMAHIGLLQALEENDIHPQVISGSSAGALVGALYAVGCDTEEMLRFFRSTPIFKFAYYSTTKPGLLNTDKYRLFFEQYFPNDDFSALQKTLYITATDLINAQGIVFSEGEIITPLLASASLPPIFTPIEINGVLYADGGIMDNFPIAPILHHCQSIIGSYVNPVAPLTKEQLTSSVNVIRRATELRFNVEAINKFPKCDYVFEPSDITSISLIDTKRVDEAYEIGYRTAIENMDHIKQSLEAAEQKTMKPLDRDRITILRNVI
ncbi:MAG: patatin-like phospholipase family protein [Bacteroidota bacterium]